jgi:hypothetical protein
MGKAGEGRLKSDPLRDPFFRDLFERGFERGDYNVDSFGELCKDEMLR